MSGSGADFTACLPETLFERGPTAPTSPASNGATRPSSQPEGTTVSLFRNTTTLPRAFAAPWLQPRAKPWFSSLATISSHSKAASASRVPSVEPLSTTTTWSCCPRVGRSDRRHRSVCSQAFHARITMVTAGLPSPGPAAMGVALHSFATGCTWCIAGTTSRGARELRGVGKRRTKGACQRRNGRRNGGGPTLSCRCC